MKEFLSIQEAAELKKAHSTCKNKKHADRIKTVLMLNRGKSFKEISEDLLLDDSTLRYYHSDYLTGGIKALLRDDYKGGTAHLSYEQTQLLVQHLEETTYLCAKEIQAYIAMTYEITYSVEGVKSLLHRLGFVYKKAKHVPGKADYIKQEEFIKEYEALKTAKNLQDKIYFMDGCHPRHNSVAAYGWIKKGKERQLRANTGREHLNINGAYNIEDHQVIVRNDERINAQSAISLINQIIQHQSAGIIYIICDNAKYYRSKDVGEFLKKNTRVKIIFLPPYSPNLNAIERLWWFFKKKKLYNQYYEKFAVFREECMSFFENIQLYKNELKTLMTDSFHVIKLSPCVSKT